MNKSVSNGMVLYIVIVTLLLIYFVAQHRGEKDRAKEGFEALYSVCESIGIAAPYLLVETPIEKRKFTEELRDPMKLHQGFIAMHCKHSHEDEFHLVRERLARRDAKARGQ